MRDFTHQIYTKLLEELLAKNYDFITTQDFFSSNFNQDRPFILMRHDVDRRPYSSLALAKLEASMGIKSTYYFRTISTTFKPKIIKEIASLGHEIGYHYESLAETNGNYEDAIKDFEFNLKRLREIYPISNIAMHGRPTSKWDSRWLWKKYDYKKYGILSEPYFDIDFNKLFYTTDAGRAWGDDSINLRDKVDTQLAFSIKHTEDIIFLLKENNFSNKLMINIHPEHWGKTSMEWYKILLIRKSKNFIKRIILNKAKRGH